MNQYIPLKSKTSSLGDEYYRCLARTLAKRDTQSIDKCVKIGRNYKKALRHQLKDLSRLKDIDFVSRERELITEYLSLIESDLDKFTKGQLDKLVNRRPNLG